MQMSKQPGVNAADVANAAVGRIESLKNTVIPEGVEVTVTRNYGETATEKAQKLIGKLIFATAFVVAAGFLRARPARGGDRRRRRDADPGRDAVRLLGLGLHAQPRVAVRADLLDRHPGR
jgi:hypothetical protein